MASCRDGALSEMQRVNPRRNFARFVNTTSRAFLFGEEQMINVKVNDGNIRQEVKGLESLMTSNPDTAKRLRNTLSKLLIEARKETADDVKSKYGGEREPWRSVRNTVYKKVLGGNLNILNMKKGTAKWKWINKVRKVEQNPRMQGGNRRKITMKTGRSEGYEGKARGFILRFQNEGTNARHIKFTANPNRHVDQWNKHPNTGNRAQVGGGHFFEQAAGKALNVMSQKMGDAINTELEKIHKEKTQK